MGTADDLVAFLNARLAEEELAAGMFSGDPCWSAEMLQRLYKRPGDPVLVHAARYDPARMLREIAAKRSILAECGPRARVGVGAARMLAQHILRTLASIYSDEPGFRQEWKP